MRRPVMRWSGRTLIGAMLMMFATPLTAWALQPIEVVGTADFRDPPALMSGQYSDTIVTGDTVWYAILYTNNTPYRFEVSLPGVDLGAQNELTLEASFIGPTLGSVGESAALVAGPGAAYNSGDTNVWYIKVALETTGRLGVEYRLMLDIEGAEATGFDDCTKMPECTLDDELALINEQAGQLEADLADLIERGSATVAQIEIDELHRQVNTSATQLIEAEAGLAGAEARLAQLCAPSATCETFPDPGTTTSPLAWALGALVLAGGARAIVKRLRQKMQKGESEADSDAAGLVQPAKPSG